MISPAKILAIGLYRGNSHLKIGPTFNVGKCTVIVAAQDVIGSLYELWDDDIKFPENLADTTASIQPFEGLSSLPNIVGAVESSNYK